MRIIGGEYRSRLIAMPKGAEIRPTQDKVRQAVFNLLQDVSRSRALELFAGSGAFGIEALSRGAEHATFVDNNSRCIDTIRSNLESLGVDNHTYDMIRASALSVLPALAREGKRFDLIFLDPPYYKDMAKMCLIKIDSCDILSRTGLVVAEHFRRDELPSDLKTMKLCKVRRYGDTVITIFRKTIWADPG